MRFQKFITEATLLPEEKTEFGNLFQMYERVEAKKFHEILKKDCKPFLSQIRKKPLWRGMYQKPDSYDIRVPRQDRRPMNTEPELQKILDDIFKEKFGWKPRSSGVFVTGKRREAEKYGRSARTICTIWPIGNFKFLWSPDVLDLYYILPPFKGAKMDFLFLKKSYSRDTGYPRDWSKKDDPDVIEGKEILKEMIHDVYTDKNLAKAIESDYEIMLGCKKYYAANLELTEELAKLMNLDLS